MSNRIKFIFLSSLCYLTACHKKMQPPVIHLEPHAKAQFNIKAGSYWVYRDSLSNQSDSFSVVDSRSGNEDISSGNVFGQYEQISVSIRQQYSGPTADDHARWQFEISPDFNKPGISNILLAAGYGNFSTGYFLDLIRGQYPFKEADTNGYIINTYTAYTLNGMLYNNVVHYFKRDPIYPADYSICIFNDSIGVIKMEINQEAGGLYPKFHKIWELERAHLVK